MFFENFGEKAKQNADMFVFVCVCSCVCVCVWLLFSAYKTCSTSFANGNQVDGLLLVVNEASMLSPKQHLDP